MRPLHWSGPLAFNIGILLGVFSASAKWPDMMPWGVAFWIGWLLSEFSRWQWSLTKCSDRGGQ